MGSIIKFIYDNIAFQNYGLAIIIFTLLVKTVLMPLTVKQQLSMARMNKFQPELQKIQKRYKNNPEKQSIEMQKFYKENKINPAGGCLPMVFQMPILFALYYAISQPLKYMAGKSAETIEKLIALVPEGMAGTGRLKDLSILSYFSNNPEAIEATGGLINPSDLINLNFLGINLGDIPSSMFSSMTNMQLSASDLLLLIIPIIAAGTSYLSTKYSMRRAEQAETKINSDSPMSGMQNSMTMMGPVMSGVISFTLPASMGLYWIIGNIFQLGQQFVINKIILEEPKQKELRALRRLIVNEDV